MNYHQLLKTSDVWALNLSKWHPLEANNVAEDVAAYEQIRKGRPPKAKGSIAMLSLEGALTQKGSWWGTSTEAFGRAFDAAIANDKVGAVLIDISSPGGDVRGTMELSDKIFNARGPKPIVSVANSDAHSAAFWDGSAADQLFVTPGGEVGSVGVWTAHIDQSRMFDKIGLDVTLIHSGKHKIDGHPFAPLPDEVRADIQADVDSINANFHAALARNFGITKKDVAENFGDGKSFMATEAVKRGMAHGVRTFEDVANTMSGRGSSRSDSRVSMELQAAFYGVEVAAVHSVEARKRLLDLRMRESA